MNESQRTMRAGTVLICVLVCILITSTMAATALQTALRERREIRLLQQMRQTELLLDAGVMRAARQLHASSEYRGEQWRPIDSVARFEHVLVEIKVTKTLEKQASQVEVIAKIGSLEQNQVPTQRTHTFTLDHPPASKAEKL